MAREWARKSDYFYNVWLERGGSLDYRFAPDELASYIPSEGWLEWVGEQDAADAVFGRIHELGDALPRHRGGCRLKRRVCIAPWKG